MLTYGYGMFLQMQHPDWAIVLFLVLSELKILLLRINYAILVTSHCFLVASYIQGKSTKNTVNRVRLGPLVVENFVVK